MLQSNMKDAFRFVSSKKSVFYWLAICGVAILASSFIAYSHYQINRLEKKLVLTNLAWKRRSLELEHRVRREVSNQQVPLKSHEIVKRQAEAQKVFRRPVEEIVTHSSGAKYTRWGRSDCTKKNDETLMVYHGIAAGSYYTHTGGGANYICLHNNITYTPGKYIEGNQGGSHLYGVEWRDGVWIHPLFNLEGIKQVGVQYHSLSCAVCIARGRFTQIMIPGREECPYGFTTEYKGYIMSGSHGDKHASEYICVDEKPTVIPGTSGDNKGSSIHMVETQCASLLCEPVVAGREIRCVVCSI